MGAGGGDERAAGAAGAIGEDVAEPAVAADAAAEADARGVEFAGGAEGFGDEDIDDGFLEAGAEVGEAIADGVAELGEEVEETGFEAAEGEGVVAAVEHGAREGEGFGVAGAGGFLDGGAAGVGEA